MAGGGGVSDKLREASIAVLAKIMNILSLITTDTMPGAEPHWQDWSCIQTHHHLVDDSVTVSSTEPTFSALG